MMDLEEDLLYMRTLTTKLFTTCKFKSLVNQLTAFYYVQALMTLKAMEVQAFIHVKRYGKRKERLS